MKWIEVTIEAGAALLQPLCEFLEISGIDGLVIEDEKDFTDFLEENRQYWDYVDEALMRGKKGVSRVKFYLPDDEDGRRRLLGIKKGLEGDTQFFRLEISTAAIADEDWEENWKQYYKPIEVGSRLIIIPDWEDKTPENPRIPLRLDPGLMFGTGTHPTTRMCLEKLEECVKPEMEILDLGTGSGILAIAAILLGARRAVGCDIDEKAPAIAGANAEKNGIGKNLFSVYAGNVLSDRDLREELAGKYDVVTANIVADVIIALAPDVKNYMKDDGVFICSGIIDGRQDETERALISGGLEIIGRSKQEDWHSLLACISCKAALTPGK